MLVVCVCSYVIFNHEESYLRCLDDYEDSGSIWGRFWQPPPLRFRRLHGIHVQAAPEPSNVLWEHLDTPYVSRMARLAFTTFLSVMLLIGSFFAVLYAQTNKTVRPTCACSCCGDRTLTRPVWCRTSRLSFLSRICVTSTFLRRCTASILRRTTAALACSVIVRLVCARTLATTTLASS